ncbi:hypothetical protein [Neisseria dentiae]|uniref:hypothetical protein n=1 Tax=Neisseria dentiae TaxID=194197 RepID=UPI0035A138D1
MMMLMVSMLLTACQSGVFFQERNEAMSKTVQKQLDSDQEKIIQNPNLYFLKHSKPLSDLANISKEDIVSIDLYLITGMAESFVPRSTADKVKNTVGEPLGYRDMFGSGVAHYRINPTQHQKFISLLNNMDIVVNPNQAFHHDYRVLVEIKYKNKNTVQILAQNNLADEHHLRGEIIGIGSKMELWFSLQDMEKLFYMADSSRKLF